MLILGLETSCDETGVALVEGKRGKVKIRTQAVASQIYLHAPYKGIVPEVAARDHIKKIIPLIKICFSRARLKLTQLDAVAVTTGPGLLVSLLIGVETARTLAYVFKKPIIPINHIEAHLYANFISPSASQKNLCPKFPLVCLVVSGGHTTLILMAKHGRYEILGQTLDDASGEAFDKVGNLLGLPYPGGPHISKIAAHGNPKAFNFPRAWLKDSYNFSFSGLKTAVLYTIKKLGPKRLKRNPQLIADLAASFQQAVIDVLVKKTIQAASHYPIKAVCLAGGVAANPKLRQTLRQACQTIKKEFFVPPPNLCTDNGAMVAASGYFHALRKDFTPWQKIRVSLQEVRTSRPQN